MAEIFLQKVVSANPKYLLGPPGISFSKLDILFYIDIKSNYLSFVSHLNQKSNHSPEVQKNRLNQSAKGFLNYNPQIEDIFRKQFEHIVKHWKSRFKEKL